MSEKVMDIGFSMFNCHINDAKDRANAAFIKLYGQDVFDKKIQPIVDKGIMSIFDKKCKSHRLVYAALVHAFVNEDREVCAEGQ